MSAPPRFKRTYTVLQSGKHKKTLPGKAAMRRLLGYIPDEADKMNVILSNPPIPSGAPSGLYNISVSKEFKFKDTDLTQLTLNSGSGNAQLFLCNGLKLGTAAFNRIGNKITMKALYWSITFGVKTLFPDITSANQTHVTNIPMRFMVVYDKQSNGAAFTLADLLSNVVGVDNTTSRTIDQNSANNLNNRERFIVIADKRFNLQSGGPSTKIIKKYKRLNTSVAYKSGATVGDITDITSGAVYALYWRDGPIPNFTENPTVDVAADGLMRLRYSDD